jgi:hypothetical protein
MQAFVMFAKREGVRLELTTGKTYKPSGLILAGEQPLGNRGDCDRTELISAGSELLHKTGEGLEAEGLKVTPPLGESAQCVYLFNPLWLLSFSSQGQEEVIVKIPSPLTSGPLYSEEFCHQTPALWLDGVLQM